MHSEGNPEFTLNKQTTYPYQLQIAGLPDNLKPR